MSEHPIEGLMETAMNSIKDMVDVNTIIGEPIETSNNNYIEVAVTFNKTFNTIPTVILTPDSVAPGFNAPIVAVKTNSITKTGFTMVYSSNYTAGLTNKVSYLAIE